MMRISRIIAYALATLLSLGLVGAMATAGLYLYLAPQLPSVQSLRDVRFQQPLRVYAADGELIAEFGDYRREPLRHEEIPERMKQAFIAAEDQRFYVHPGVDYQGLARAVIHLVKYREIGPGGSTITMQVARNFFLSREQTYLRKLNEILLALKIEQELSKEQILELYLNKIYLGQRAYGVGAAARIYYGRHPNDLTLAETATIAGLPKSPSTANPVANPERSMQRRAYVLRRMFELGHISTEEMAVASTQPVTASVTQLARPGLDAPFIAEMARAQAVERFGEEAYTDGYRIHTTIDSRLQRQANTALRNNLIAYDERHGYRGAESRYDLDAQSEQSEWDRILGNTRRTSMLHSALVVEVDEESDLARVYLGAGEYETLALEDVQWARRWVNQAVLGDPIQKVSDVLHRGDLVRVRTEGGRLRLGQIPEIEGALVSLSPDAGAIVALAGGFDFHLNQFNRAVQALRQPGSAFKPFIYSAALERGFTPATVVNDAPVVFEDDALETVWRPENYSGRFYGPTRLRQALVHSRNLVSIRVLRDIGTRYAVSHLERFGFPRQRMPADLSLALGSASVTPLELATGYAVFANGGYRVEPYVVSHIEDSRGEVVFRSIPTLACNECEEMALSAELMGEPESNGAVEGDESAAELVPYFRPAERTLSAENAYLITSMLQDVIRSGTGRAARALGRDDLAGKTGTTNDLHDSWFAGYNSHLVTTAWIGFDQARSMGPGETGSRAALPIWVDFMRVALRDLPDRSLSRPAGLITARIDPESGLLTSADNPQAIFEVFDEDEVPAREREGNSGSAGGRHGGAEGSGQPLF